MTTINTLSQDCVIICGHISSLQSPLIPTSSYLYVKYHNVCGDDLSETNTVIQDNILYVAYVLRHKRSLFNLLLSFWIIFSIYLRWGIQWDLSQKLLYNLASVGRFYLEMLGLELQSDTWGPQSLPFNQAMQHLGWYQVTECIKMLLQTDVSLNHWIFN